MLVIDSEDHYCALCRDRRNLPPLTLPILRPWYERMTEEEMAVIRAKPWTASSFKEGPNGEMIQTVHKTDLQRAQDRADKSHGKEPAKVDYTPTKAVNYTQAVSFNVRYRKTDVDGHIDLMVGKLIPHGEYGSVFLHAAAESGGEGQSHNVTDCPCPVDNVLVERLVELGVKYFYAYDRDNEILYRADVADLAQAPAAVYAAKTIRTRRFLESGSWKELPKVREVTLSDRRTRNLLRGDRLIMSVPWANQEVTIGTDPAAF